MCYDLPSVVAMFSDNMKSDTWFIETDKHMRQAETVAIMRGLLIEST